MKRSLLPALVASILAIGSASAWAAPRTSDVAVTVRTYNYATVPAPELERARETARLIFRNAGIALRWIQCRVPGSENGASCTEPLSEGREFMLRLMAGIETHLAERKVALGESILDRDIRGGVLITIDPDLVGTIARNSSAEKAPLLGRAMAHELGHLLLGLSQHPRAGLMRAFWSSEEIGGIRPSDWQFSQPEAAQMRQGLLVRARPAN